MTGRIDSWSSNGSGRPFSTTNPFRTNGMESPQSFGNDRRFNDWNNDPVDYQRAPARPTSTNPFLDDADSIGDDHIYSRKDNNGNNKHSNRRNNDRNDNNVRQQQYPTSREEKDALRQRYLNDSSPNNNNSGSVDLPPSYDEVADKRASSGKKYASEKDRRRHHSSNSHEHRQRSSSHGHDRSHRYHSSSSPSKKEKRKSKMIPGKGVDTIDKLDVTGLFGGSFHHDGPFDACTPHRNKNNKAAPVLAFPVDGPNSTIGGATTKQSTINEVFGVNDIDDDDDIYNVRPANQKSAIKSNVTFSQVDTTSKTQQVHGQMTSGLGSSTFLDGVPAVGTGLERGKSVSYRKIDNSSNNIRRNMSMNSRPTVNRYNSRENFGSSRTHGDIYNRNTSNSMTDDEDDVYVGVRFDDKSTSTKKMSTGNKLLRRVKSLKVGGRKN